MELLNDLGHRVVGILGKPAARDLLDALSRPETDRAALIGRLFRREDARWLADLLTDLEVDEPARLQLASLGTGP